MVSRNRRTLNGAGTPLDVDEEVLRFVDGRIIARRWYWVDGEFTASAIRAKLLQLRARVSGRGDVGAIIVVYMPLVGDGDSAPPVLDELTRDAAATLEPLLAQRLRAGAAQ